MMVRMETFVVRIFVPAFDGDTLPLSGIVEHVASGRAEPFQGSHDLLALVREALERLPASELTADEKRDQA